IATTSFQCTRTLILLSAKKETNIDTTKSIQMSHIFIKTLIPEAAAFLQKIKETCGVECTSQENSYKLDVVEESIKTLLTTNAVAQDSH
ncbi:17939_t:CDS:1, partial [Racocetra fulgida]